VVPRCGTVNNDEKEVGGSGEHGGGRGIPLSSPNSSKRKGNMAEQYCSGDVADGGAVGGSADVDACAGANV
jgi:hypothetical protein